MDLLSADPQNIMFIVVTAAQARLHIPGVYYSGTVTVIGVCH